MSELNRLIKLLGQTDGRDKIYKFLAGLFKILAEISAKNSDSHAKAYKALSSSIGSARSLMRMGKFVGDIPKLESIVTNVQKKGLSGTEIKKFIEFFRVIGNSLYIIGDNVAFGAKYQLIPVNNKVAAKYSKIAQFWGFFLASLLDILSLHVALRKRLSDEETCRKEAKAAIINFTRDTADVLVTMSTVGYLKEIWNPSNLTTGALACLSGGVATYLNWNKIS